MARGKAWIAATASLPVFALAIAAAPAAGPGPSARSEATSAKATLVAEMESNERIVSDFLLRRERAERAQRAIIDLHRRTLDLRRAEFVAARKALDEARSRYAEIVGPLPKQGVMNPNDPRLPYEFDLRRTWPEPTEPGPSVTSQQQTVEKRAPVSGR